MAHTIFYSWQADTAEKECRTFIEQCLSKAIEELARDLTVDAAVRDNGLALDKDTKGIAGTPPIVDTIFRKIDAAAAFLADLTFVGHRLDGRPTPNPNVLVEYGWALRSLGHSRMICVMNAAHGEPSDQTLPFNMKHLRWPIQFVLPDGADSAKRQEARGKLVGELKVAIRTMIDRGEFGASVTPEAPKFEPKHPAGGAGRFRGLDESIGVIQTPLGDAHAVKLADGHTLWLRVMPAVQQKGEWSIAELRQAMSAPAHHIFPLGWFSSWSHVRGPDGFGYVPTMPAEGGTVPAVAFAFKTGEVWSVYAGPLSTRSELPNPEVFFTERFLEYVRFLRVGLRVDLPYKWIAGIEGLMGKRMQKVAPPGQTYWEPLTGKFLTNMVSETGFLGERDPVQLALKPFFNSLYDACGAVRGDHMDQALLNLQP